MATFFSFRRHCPFPPLHSPCWPSRPRAPAGPPTCRQPMCPPELGDFSTTSRACAYARIAPSQHTTNPLPSALTMAKRRPIKTPQWPPPSSTNVTPSERTSERKNAPSHTLSLHTKASSPGQHALSEVHTLLNAISECECVGNATAHFVFTAHVALATGFGAGAAPSIA